MVSPVSALLVNGRATMNFQPGLEYEGELCIIPHRIPDIEIIPTGFINDTIDFPELDSLIVHLEEPGCTPYSFVMPLKFEKPGMQKAVIEVKETVPEQTAMIAAIVSTGHQIWVDVPYPGKYLEMRMFASNEEEGNPVSIRIEAQNKGEETIEVAKGKIIIYNFNDEIVGELDTQIETNIISQEHRYFEVVWDSTGNTVGDYHAVAEMVYDGASGEEETNFKLGSLDVRMSDYTKQIYKAGIERFTVTANSYWSQSVNNVRAHISVKDMEGIVQTDFMTTMTTLIPWEEKALEGYVDTTQLALGTYDLEIKLFYEDTSKLYNGTLEVVEKPIPKVEKPGLLSSFLGSTKALFMTTLIFAIIAIVLILKMVFFGGKKSSDDEKPAEEETFKYP